MPLYKLVVCYDGTRFNGFQRQTSNQACNQVPKVTPRPPKRPHWEQCNGQRKTVPHTIQGCLEDAVLSWTGHETTTVTDLCLRAAGRTDKGVHARGQVVAVQLPLRSVVVQQQQQRQEQQQQHLANWEIRNAINSRLPCDISIRSVQQCDDAFHPRQDVKTKQYSYTIKYRRRQQCHTSNIQSTEQIVAPICSSGPNTIRDAFDTPCLWLCPWALDDSKMNDLCSALQGHHDYAAFVHKDDRKARSHILTVTSMSFSILETFHDADVEDVDDQPATVVTARFFVEAPGFRRSMVRNLVGFCVDVGRGCPDVTQLSSIHDLWTGTEQVAAFVRAAPACGLCLERVTY